jgi:hypothetical protein
VIVAEKKKKTALKKKTAPKSPPTGELPVGRPRNLVKLSVSDVDRNTVDLIESVAKSMDVDTEDVVKALFGYMSHMSRIHSVFGVASMLKRHLRG